MQQQVQRRDGTYIEEHKLQPSSSTQQKDEHAGVPDVVEKANPLSKSQTCIPRRQQVQRRDETVIEKHKSQPSSSTQQVRHESVGRPTVVGNFNSSTPKTSNPGRQQIEREGEYTIKVNRPKLQPKL